MRKEIIINSNPHEIRIGILEDGDLVELLIERADAKRIVGNLYRGVVSSVKPGLQAAFVDIGLERAGFLHASDLVHTDPDTAEDVDAPTPDSRGGRGRSHRDVPNIGDVLKVGDEILVQVTKEPISSKGPRLTADISLPGRFLVHMPQGTHVGVSRKIEDRRERVRLKQILQEARPDSGAFIIRTAAESADDKAVRNDVKYLSELWQQITQNDSQAGAAPCLVHEDVGMVVGLIRDIFNDEVTGLVIDDNEDYKRLQKYVQIFAPDLKNRIRLYRNSQAIFDHYGIEQEIRKSTEPRVWLKKGGYIIIEQTEALVSVDVNTGRFTGRRSQEETIVETNILAAREVARQLRLRDIGGIIVIDFIDMEHEGDKRRVQNELRGVLKRDRARTKIFPVSNLGLIEMSRQRVRPSLVSFLSDDCPYCKGGGKVLSLATLANRVEREVHRICHKLGERQIQIQVNPLLALYLLRERADQLDDLSREHDLTIDILDDPARHREAFNVISLRTDKDLIAEADHKAMPRGRGSRGRTAPTGRAAQPRRRPQTRSADPAPTPAPRPPAPRDPAPAKAPRDPAPAESGETRPRRRGRRGGRRRSSVPRTREES